MKRLLFLFIGHCLLLQVGLPQDSQSMLKPAAGLFDSPAPIEITLKSELKSLFSDIGNERNDHPASLVYVSQEGVPVTVAAELRARGNFRRQRSVCNLPPLRVKVDSDKVAGTLFVGQKKLKLVTVCQYKKDPYEQNLLMEYLIYRAYNTLTDSSFRVRLAHITFIDLEGAVDTIRRYAFFIEDEEQMAARLGGKILEINNVHPLQTHRHTTARMSMFQYMIGNTDWSVAALHNVRLVGPNGVVPPAVVPYDFDWSGVVSAPYAKPDPQLGIPTVESRLYRGFCRTREEFERVFAEFRTAKPAIYALYEQCEMLDEKYRARALAYFDEFYDIIGNEKRIDREIMSQCRTKE